MTWFRGTSLYLLGITFKICLGYSISSSVDTLCAKCLLPSLSRISRLPPPCSSYWAVFLCVTGILARKRSSVPTDFQKGSVFPVWMQILHPISPIIDPIDWESLQPPCCRTITKCMLASDYTIGSWDFRLFYLDWCTEIKCNRNLIITKRFYIHFGQWIRAFHDPPYSIFVLLPSLNQA